MKSDSQYERKGEFWANFKGQGRSEWIPWWLKTMPVTYGDMKYLTILKYIRQSDQ